MLKRLYIFCLAVLFPILCAKADSTFVESGFQYKVICKDSVNIVAWNDGYPFKDAVLNIPAKIRHNGKTYYVRGIGNSAFARCSSIRQVDISNGIEEICDSAFCACTDMEAIHIPASVRVIGEYVFSYCIALSSIYVDDGNRIFDSRDRCNAIILTRSNGLVYGCKGTKIPSSVECIRGAAYDGCLVDSVIIPEGIKNICKYAFYRCPDLTKIHISSTVEMVDGEAFYYCPNVTSITVDERNGVYDSRENCNAIIEGGCLVRGCCTTVIPSGVDVIGESAFQYCINLHSITIPEGVATVSADAFWRCHSLKRVILPCTLTCFEKGGQFGDCTSLDSIYIPDGVKELGNGMFSGCVSLHSIVVDPKNRYYDSRNNCNAIIRTSNGALLAGCNGTVIPDGVRYIDAFAFEGSGITSIDIPASVAGIDSTAFRYSERCVAITVAKDNTVYKSDGSNSIVERRTGRLVLGCATTRFLPEVTAIGSYAFVNTPEVLVLPDGICDIGRYAFAGCRKLSTVIIPHGVKHIARDAFVGCDGLHHRIIRGNDVLVD